MSRTGLGYNKKPVPVSFIDSSFCSPAENAAAVLNLRGPEKAIFSPVQYDFISHA